MVISVPPGSPFDPYSSPISLPEIRKWAQRLHLDDPTWYIEQLHGVDMDAIRTVAQDVWGTNAATAAPQHALEQIRDDLDKGLLTTVQDRWEGPAYLAFDEYVNVIQRAAQEEAERFPQVGEPLIEFADAFEVGLLEMIAHAIAVEGILLGVAGVAIAIATGVTGIGAIVGLIVGLVGVVLSIVGELIALMMSITPRLEAISAVASALHDELSAKSPLDLLPNFPADIDAWIPKTPNPYS